jgi:hypothetical protein
MNVPLAIENPPHACTAVFTGTRSLLLQQSLLAKHPHPFVCIGFLPLSSPSEMAHIPAVHELSAED